MAGKKENRDGFLKTFLLTFLVCIFSCFIAYILWYLFRRPVDVAPPQPQSVEEVRIVPPVEVIPEDEPEVVVQPQPQPDPEPELPVQIQPEPESEPVPEPQPEPSPEPEPEIAPVVDIVEPQPSEEPPATEAEETALPEASPLAPLPPAFSSVEAHVDEVIITGSDAPVYDDDFFASFFVSGSDTLQYDDGLYYFDYLVDGELMGTLEVLFQGEERLMNTGELRIYLSDLLTDEAYAILLVDGVGDYVSIDHFRDNGVAVDYDETAFTIDMTFGVDAMPERVISLAGGRSRRTFSLSGATTLEPDFFSWRAGYNLYTNLDWTFDSDVFNWSLSLSVSNYLNFGPVNFDFFYNMSLRNGRFDFNWNSYRFYYDFIDQGIRLSWGNVYGFGLSPSGTPVGIQFEKGYGYGTIESPYNSHREYLTVTEESYLQIIRNGRVIFTRTLQPGNYRIQDFIFDSGFNEVELILTPTRYLDGIDLSSDEVRNDPAVQARLAEVSYHQYFDMAYDSQLLAAGETLFGGSFNFGRTLVDVGDEASATGVLLRVSPFYYYDYHFDDITLSWYQDVGLTDEVTLMSDFSVRTYKDHDEDMTVSIGDVSLSLRGAWQAGTTTLSFDTRLDSSSLFAMPDIRLSLDHSFLFDWQYFRGVSLSLGWSNDAYNDGDGDELSMRLSFSGSVGFLRYSLSGNIAIAAYDFTRPVWRLSGSVGLSPMRGLSLSAGMTVSQGISPSNRGVQVYGYLSASFSFGGVGSGSYSTNFQSQSLSTSFSVGNRDSFALNISGFEFDDPLGHSLAGSWYHSSDLASLSLRASAYDHYNRLSLSASLSTASLFSGGLFGMSRSVRDNFVLIRPFDSLRGADVQVARSNQGTPVDVQNFLGTASYSSLSTFQRNNIVVYVTGDDEFAETQTFAYELTPMHRSGYSLRITVPQVYTVTGIVSEDGVLQTTFSSPVYRLEVDSSGQEVLVEDISLYLFADQDGRFIISGATPGTYVFDYNYDGSWYAVRFTVDELADDEIRVYDFGTVDITAQTVAGCAPSYGALVDYAGVIDITAARMTDSATFWNELFPPLSVEEIQQDFVL